MSNNPNIYELKLHQTIVEHDMAITKVPGGWIYRLESHETSIYSIAYNHVFVPEPPAKSITVGQHERDADEKLLIKFLLSEKAK